MPPNRLCGYNAPATLVKVVCKVVPTVVTVAMIASAIRPAIRPYSMAVAPDWSPRQRKANLRMNASKSTMRLQCAGNAREGRLQGRADRRDRRDDRNRDQCGDEPVLDGCRAGLI